MTADGSGARVGGFTRDGLTFDVTDTGPLDGEPVVLLHGFPQRASSWDAVAPRLHLAGLRTLAPDQRGYSPGARPRGRRAYAMPHLVADVAALVHRVGRPVHLVGHDWGAAVGWLTAANHPDLVRSLTAVSVPHPRAMLQAARRSDQLRRSWYMGLFQLPWLPERLLASPRGAGWLRAGGMTPPMLDRFQQEVVAAGALRGGLQWYRALPLSRPGTLRSRVPVPTTMVWSDRDVALARAGAELSEGWVDADFELVVLEGVSHWIPEEAPEPLADAVLRRVSATMRP